MILSALRDDTSSPASSHYTLPRIRSDKYYLAPRRRRHSLATQSHLAPARGGAVSTAAARHARIATQPARLSGGATPRRSVRCVTDAGSISSSATLKQCPAALIAADQHDEHEDGEIEPGTPECSHCHTHRTSVWRRSKSGAKLCNACGVYARLRARDRPLSLARNKIRPRCKHAKLPSQ
ncbi:hypothetical protein C8R47DRAFT_1216144 [Mycena vitilis]|nr:hypothetical protein C8R47DRAFT_1216144 [Mycena vitilis]